MIEQQPPEIDPVLSFDQFQVMPRQRLLLEAGRPVRIGSRALDILLALLESPGERIGKAELLARAWPGIHVVEGNLKFQVAALRRVLHDGQGGRRFIEASKGQGYCFVAPVAVTEESGRSALPVEVVRHHNLPEQLTPLIGRDGVVAKLAEQLTSHRLLTVVGSGGIGKTSVALAVAEKVIGGYKDGVWVVELARIVDPDLVRGTVAGAVGLEVGPGLTSQALVAALRGRRMLLVLDDCVHLVDAVAALVSTILRGAPYIRILATSREPLRCEGEHLCRLGPLEAPPTAQPIKAADALRYPAVQLFAEQAAASLDGFQLTDDDAPLAAEICRKLDGIPLAIGLAAAWVGVLGLRGLVAQLDDRLRLLTGGRRTALPKHRTMRAALDWSYDLLSPPEQMVFRRLAVFVGSFTLADAVGVAAGEETSGEEVVRLVLELAAKSLVAADLDSPGPRFRLLETTRAHALEKAKEVGETRSLAQRHATYFLGVIEAESRERAEADDGYAEAEQDINNLRAALTWAFAPGGDPTIGIGLVVASLPLWFSASLLGEAHAWVQRAIQTLDAAGLHGSRQEMVLQAAYGISLQMVRARTSEAHAALSRALDLAEQLQDTNHRLHVLHTLWIYHMRIGEVGTALNVTRAAEAIVGSIADPIASGTVEWMRGITMHFAGEHEVARVHLEHQLFAIVPRPRRRQICSSGFDLHVTARYMLAHVLWVQGHPDKATEAVRQSVEEARRLQHPITLCSVLAWGACAQALLARDLDEAWRSATELVAYAEKHALADHVYYGRAALEVISLQKAGSQVSVEQVRTTLQRWRDSQWHVFLSLGEFAGSAAAAGLAEEMSAVVDEALQRAERDQDLWAHPEMLRIKGELLLRQNFPNPEKAKEYFEHALARARAQGALSWQLRAAASLFRLCVEQGDATESREVLSQTYAHFREGFDSADLILARQLLDL